MYQGKFEASVRGHKSPDENLKKIIEDRSAANAARQAKKAAASAAKPQVQKPAAQAAKPAAPRPQAQKPAAQNANPAASKPQVQKQPVKAGNDAIKFDIPPAKPPVKPAAPVLSEDAPKKPVKAAAQKKGPRVGSVIFYTIYFLYIFVFFVGTFLGLQWLKGWLVRYEAAQPTVKSQEVFDAYFANPDWEKLYSLAQVSNTAYEGVEEFVPFMEEKLGGKSFDYVETSGGLSEDKKFIVRADGEKFATFTLKDLNADDKSEVAIPDWELNKIELFFTRQQGYLIQKLDTHTAYVNGVALDDSFTIQTASTVAEKFLPIGVSGIRTSIQSISGLLMPPTVTIYNQVGEEMEVVYDEATGTFVEQTQETTMTDAEKEAVLGAMKGYAEFMINASGSRAAVTKWFDTSSDTYNEILKMHGELWMNGDNGHSFHDESINGYARYSDDLFSVHGHIEMNVNLKNGGGQRDYPIDVSMFFRKKNGKWVCYEMTNEDVTTPVGEVRLTYMNGDEMLTTGFVNTNSKELITPVISVPDGKVFSGWAKKDVSDTGRVTYTLMFVPDGNGQVLLNSGTALQPMTLYALIEDAQ